MFKKFKQALGLGGAPKPTDSQIPASLAGVAGYDNKVSEWAHMQGLNFSQHSDRRGGYHIEGKVDDKLWRIEQGAPSRNFIKGTELRARAELGVHEDIAIMVMNRQLKNSLDEHAFKLYTDSVQTIADPHLPEEMRWLSIYEEMGWESLGTIFLNNYAILADNRENAMAWISQELADSLMAWPGLDPQSPKILMLLRGNAYLRIQHIEGDLATLEHATGLFTTACKLALSGLKIR